MNTAYQLGKEAVVSSKLVDKTLSRHGKFGFNAMNEAKGDKHTASEIGRAAAARRVYKKKPDLSSAPVQKIEAKPTQGKLFEGGSTYYAAGQ